MYNRVRHFGNSIFKFSKIIMPKRRQPSSLKQLCISDIAWTFERIWWRDYFDNFGGTQCLHVLGPFDALPSGLVEEIIKVMETNGQLQGKYLQILFTDRLRHLHLKGTIITNQIVKLLAQKARKLETLHLKYANKISKNLLVNLVENLPAIKELNLTETKCDDNMLQIISLNCPHLVKLSVMNCHGVTDRGIQSICSGQTRKLQNISLQDSGATEQSVIHLLRTFPELKEVEMDNNISGLLQVIEEDIVNGKMDSKYGIQKIHWDTSVPLSAHLSLIVDHCPFVTDVTCHGVISGDVLKKLSCIKTMKKLNLSYGHGYAGHHDLREFVEFLQEVGIQITDLFLSDTMLMPVREIGVFCLNLKALTMICDSNLTRARAVQASEDLFHPNSFKKLETIKLFDNNVIRSEDTVTFLLCQAENVRFLDVHKCMAFTSEGLDAAYQKHGFKQLESLKLDNCHNFDDIDILELMLETENKLSVMHLCSCFNITFVHSDELQLALQEGENWNIEYHWE